MKIVNLKNPVMASWLREQGFGLDAPPFLSGAIETRKLLEQLPVKDPLALLTQGDLGIFHAGRIKRNWVTELEYGIPFLSSTDILQADLSSLPLISKQVVTENPQLTIRKDWILVTRSGSIGRMAYARPDMDGMACSEHVLRVVPEPNHILPGYLYAFLSSKFRRSLVVGSTYGAIIPHIEPHHLADLHVPRLGEKVETRAHELVQEAAEARTNASRLLRQASADLLQYFVLPPIQHSRSSISLSTFRVYASQLSRLDAAHHSPICAQPAQCLARALPSGTEKIGHIAKVFTPGIFKRIHVNDPTH